MSVAKPVRRLIRRIVRDIIKAQKKYPVADREWIRNMYKTDPRLHSPGLKKELEKGIKGYHDLIFVEPKSELSFAKGRSDLEQIAIPHDFSILSIRDFAPVAKGKIPSSQDLIDWANEAFKAGIDIVDGGRMWRAVNPNLRRTKYKP